MIDHSEVKSEVKKQLCSICQKNESNLLCDFGEGSGIVTTLDFKELKNTCDKPLCQECSVSLWFDCDLCPEHARVVGNKIFIHFKQIKIRALTRIKKHLKK